MRLLLITLFSGYWLNSFCQNTQIEYKLFYDTDSPMTMYATLYTGRNVSIYQEKYGTKEAWKEREKPLPEGVVVHKARITDFSTYLKTDRNKKEVLFFDNISTNYFLIRDIYPEFSWNITEEIKDISGYKCLKATTKYRGREWVAWFSPEIPLSFGPWKLHGLPGLILEAYDVTNKYTFKAVKVEFVNNNDILEKDFSSIVKTKNKEPVSYRQFMEDEKETRNNIMTEAAAKSGGTVTRFPVPRSGEELIFEWE